MKITVIFAPFHFDKEEMVINFLNSIVTKESVFVSYASIPIARILKKYTNDLTLELHLIHAEWNKFGKDAGLIRDKTMIEMADEIIVFNDCNNPKIQKTIQLIHSMKRNLTEIEIDPVEKFTYYYSHKELAEIINPNELIYKLSEIEKLKAEAISNCNYEYAALLRDKIRFLNERLEQL